ncbi:MAG: hypothetical protein IJX62_09700, partial [Clostridia bacterium]|nr:hypothetical protein [Clostridia bacterium]
YCILALHWFNPLVWIAFVLFCKDIEYACDEKVLKNAAADIRKEYATALLECASKRSFLAACPIAFGEVSVKERVKKTMNYKRPLLWVIIVSVLLCALVAVLFFTAPMDEESAPNTPSEEQTSSEASTELSAEESTESSIEESSVTEPSEPEVSEPEESEPEASEPEVSEPEVSEPEISEPEVSEPEVSEPEVSDPPEEPVIPPTLELPPEKEATVEQVLRFDMGPGHPFSLWAYTNGYPEFGRLIIEQPIFTDGEENFYLDLTSSVKRFNDGAKLPSAKRNVANSEYVLSGGRLLWLEDRILDEDIYILRNEAKEVVSRIKVSVEQPYRYQPCEIRYTTSEYSGKYATVKYYRPFTIKVNEVTFENVVEYQVFHGKEDTLYLALFFADYGAIYAVTGGVTHEELTPATEGADRENRPILFTAYELNQNQLKNMLDDPAGYSFSRGEEIWIDASLLYYLDEDPFLLWPELVELATEPAALEAYLKEQGFSCKVTSITAIDSEFAPFTLMAVTETGDAYFVTAKVDYPTKEQVYAAYSLEDYRNTFLSREVKVVVNGTEMTPKYTVTAYGENTMLPIVQVLQALGGTVEQVDGGVSITLDGNQCFVYFGEHCIMYGDEQWAYGWEVEYHRDELLIPRGELQSIFDVFCPGVEIRVEIEENTVYITR